MERFLDAACVTPEGDTIEVASILKNNKNGWSDWLTRKISAAYDEHATIIASLHEELDAAKNREKALVQEFTQRFKMIQKSVPGTNRTLAELCTSRAISGEISYEEEMPMDEKAEAARLSKCTTNLERRDKRRIDEKFKEITYQEMENMRRTSEKKIQAIESALKKKSEEIEALRNESQVLVSKQSNGKVKSKIINMRAKSPATALLPVSSQRKPSDENFPNRNPNLPRKNLQHPQPHIPLKMISTLRDESVAPIIRLRLNTPKKKRLPGVDNPPISPRSSVGGVIDAIHRVRSGSSASIIPSTFSSPSVLEKSSRGAAVDPNYEHELNKYNNVDTPWGLQASLMALDGSAIDNEKDLVHNEPPKSIPDSAMKNNSQETKSRHLSEQENAGAHVLTRLFSAIDAFLQQKPVDNQSIELCEKERSFIESVKLIFHSSQKQQKHEINVLKKDLEGTTKDLREGAVQALELNKTLKENEEYILELEKQLSSANHSLKNTTDLEDMLRMLGDNQKVSQLEHFNLRQKLLETEKAMDALLKEKQAYNDNGSESSVSAIRRVLVDVTAEKEEAVEELTAQIDRLTDENDRLMKQIDTFADSQSNSGIERESTKVEQQAQKILDLERKQRKMVEDLKESKLQKEEALNSLEQSRDTIINLEKELDFPTSAERKIEELTNEIEGLKRESSAAEAVLKSAKEAHAREQKLEDEMRELRSLLDKSMKEVSDLKSEIYAKSEAMSNVKKKSANEILLLQVEIKNLIEQKTSLEQRWKRVQRKDYTANEALHPQDKMDNKNICHQDIKKAIHEQQLLYKQLRLVSNNSGLEILKKLSLSTSTLLYMVDSVKSPTSIADNGIFDYECDRGRAITKTSEKKLEVLRIENEKIREEVRERDQELLFLNAEMSRMKEVQSSNMNNLFMKEEELRLVKESLNDASVGYISGDESDTDSENYVPNDTGSMPLHEAISVCKDSNDRELCVNLIKAKEDAEKRAKSNQESLANAKMIIASLEQSNKKMTQDLRSRLHDSNLALVSVLEQSQKHEKESAILRVEIDKLKKSKANNTILCDSNEGNEKYGKE